MSMVHTRGITTHGELLHLVLPVDRLAVQTSLQVRLWRVGHQLAERQRAVANQVVAGDLQVSIFAS